jgi:hypothetical protein
VLTVCPWSVPQGDTADRLTVHFATWNVGNALPPPSLHPLVGVLV